MTEEETIELLKGMQNKKVDYAELVCAPAFAYGYEYVYPEPEDYAIEEAIKALEEVQQYRKIGTVEEFREFKEKRIPKECVIDSFPDHTDYKCPSCGLEYMTLYTPRRIQWGRMPKFCECCGQAIKN